MHQELQIVKGYPAMPDGVTESNSNETSMEIIDLLGTVGFAVEQDGWTPAFAQIRNSGVYAEAVASDGSYLLGASKGRVTQSIKLTASAASYNSRYWLESKLRRMGEAARKFHYEPKLDPVYLKWHAQGAPGPQYTLIYSIEIAQTTNFSGPNVNQLTITVEHQPEWLPIPPFAHPREWSIAQGYASDYELNEPGAVSEYAYAVTSLINGPTIGQKSHIDIPASKIPGDAPALVCFRMEANLEGQQNLITAYMARRTRGLDYQTNADGTLRNSIATNTWPVYVVPTANVRGMFETTAGTGGVFEDDKGTFANGDASFSSEPSATRKRLKVTFGTPGDTIRLTWQTDMTTFAGRWAAFLRCHQSSGAQDDLRVYLQYGYDGKDAVTDEVAPKLQAVTTHTEFWPLLYLGEVTFPPDSARSSMNLGTGANRLGQVGLEVRDVKVGGGQENLIVNLRARRAAGTTAELYVSDLILMPVDEPSVFISFEQEPFDVPITQLPSVILDGTGYMSRQPSGAFYCAYYDSSTGEIIPARLPEIRSAGFTLEPGVKNRIYFLFTSDNDGVVPPTLQRSSIVRDPNTGSESAISCLVDIDIIPRWYGVRDV